MAGQAHAATGYARYIGRVGALAVALGVGTAVATGQGFGVPVARADAEGSSADASSTDAPSTDSSTGEPSATTATDTTSSASGSSSESEPTSGAEPSAQSASGSSQVTEPAPGVVISSSGGAHTSGAEDEEATEPDDEVEPTEPSVEPTEETQVPVVLETPVEEQTAPFTDEAPAADPKPPATEDTDSHETQSDSQPIEESAPASSATTSHGDQEPAVVRMSAVSESAPAVPVGGRLTAAADMQIIALDAAPSAAIAASEPVEALSAAPDAVVSVASNLLAAVFSPFLAPGPTAPAQPPLLWALLGWVRREIQRAFFNRTPDAVDDVVATAVEDNPEVIDALGNDTDVEDDPISITSFTQPAHGTVVQNPDGTFTYTPAANYHGPDSFTYTVRDQGFHLTNDVIRLLTGAGPRTDTATVNLTVIAVNDAPVAVDDDYSVTQGGVLTVPAPGLLTNDTDADGDPLTVEALAFGPANGHLTLNPDGSFTYTPNAPFTGTDTFGYGVTDGTDNDIATVTITVTAAPPNTAPVAVDDDYSVTQGGVLTVPAPGLLTNDTDADGDPLTVEALAFGPANGHLTLNPDGSFTYTPNAPFTGTDTFGYGVTDGTDNDIATVTITVTAAPPNTAPVAVDDDYSVTQGGVLTVPAPGLLTNDTDADGDPLTVEALAFGPANGPSPSTRTAHSPTPPTPPSPAPTPSATASPTAPTTTSPPSPSPSPRPHPTPPRSPSTTTTA